MKLISLHDAKAEGLKRYFTGKPCRYGHVSERFVSNAGCLECNAVKKAVWNSNNKERNAERKRIRYAENSEHVRAVKKAWNKANPEGQKARSRRWYEANKDKANEATARWRKNNLATACAAQARRRMRKIGQTPLWADHKSIRQIYKEARRLTQETGQQYHVDHIVPLQSDLVCGLHVESNLQLLPGLFNRAKGNRFWPDKMKEY